MKHGTSLQGRDFLSKRLRIGAHPNELQPTTSSSTCNTQESIKPVFSVRFGLAL
jgi:hypothetical protein